MIKKFDDWLNENSFRKHKNLKPEELNNLWEDLKTADNLDAFMTMMEDNLREKTDEDEYGRLQFLKKIKAFIEKNSEDKSLENFRVIIEDSENRHDDAVIILDSLTRSDERVRKLEIGFTYVDPNSSSTSPGMTRDLMKIEIVQFIIPFGYFFFEKNKFKFNGWFIFDYREFDPSTYFTKKRTDITSRKLDL